MAIHTSRSRVDAYWALCRHDSVSCHPDIFTDGETLLPSLNLISPKLLSYNKYLDKLNNKTVGHFHKTVLSDATYKKRKQTQYYASLPAGLLGAADRWIQLTLPVTYQVLEECWRTWSFSLLSRMTTHWSRTVRTMIYSRSNKKHDCNVRFVNENADRVPYGPRHATSSDHATKPNVDLVTFYTTMWHHYLHNDTVFSLIW